MSRAAVPRKRPYAARMAPEQRREQLLDIVLELIGSYGVGSVNIDAVARRADVTRPVVYNHFADRDDLLRASLDREEQRALAQLADAVPQPGSTDLAADFHHLFDTYLHAVAEAPLRWRAIFLVADSSTPEFHRRVERGRARFVREFGAVLHDTLLAHQLLAVLWESGRLRLISPDEFGHDRLLHSLDTLFTALKGTR
ncbi:MAG TPA: TetR/AcrR family transcriptional regulator [Pseudonocardiaceae bacterium]|nr:TetR/AcrR family transcriptional regulator [Pseudonocardiaceae bacterium]